MDGKLRNMTSLYLVSDTHVLCLYRIGSRVADRKYIGSAGGHFEQGEYNDAKKCVLRELEEELGIREENVAGLRLRYITYRLKDGEIRQNYYFFGQLKEDRPLTSTEGLLQWIPFAQIPGLEMPLSAKHMILHYLETGRFDEKLYAGITQEKGTTFVVMEDFPG